MTTFEEWARRRAVRLDRVEDRGAPDEPVEDADLTSFAAMVGDARIVAIGESFHHTHEFLALRERLVRYLVERLGFGTIVLEVVRPGRNAIDDFVQHGAGDGMDALVSAGARMWRNRETLRIVDWAASYNRRNAGAPLRVVGMDVLAPGAGMRTVLDHVAVADAERVVELSRGFDVDGREDQIFYNALSAGDRALMRDAFRRVLETLTIDQAAWRDRLGGAVCDRLVEQAIVVLQALRMLEAGTAGWQTSLALRDEALAENVARLIAADPGRRLIILSHNMHINAAGPVQAEGRPAAVAMGIFLRQRLGEAYLAVGTTYGEARFDPPIYGVRTAPGDDRDSIDQALAAVAGGGPLLIDLRGGDDRPPSLDGPSRMQATGSGAGSHVLHHPIGAAYDVLAFVPCVTNAAQLVETELSLDIAAIDATRRA